MNPKQSRRDERDMSFWAHLDELRGVLIRCATAWAVAAVVAFFFKDQLFGILLHPAQGKLISTELTGQFMTHVQVSFWAGLIVALPYIIWQLYLFVQPAIGELKHTKWLICLSAMSLFFAGVLLNYFLIFPFAYQFLVTYQVQNNVENMITLTSYMGTFLTLSLMMGILFELPLVAWALAKMGLLQASILQRYRKHAIVFIVILAAVITPTGDAFTLLLVSVPVYLLYELSIGIVARVNRKNAD